MAVIDSSEEYIFSTEIGTVKVVISQARKYDVEDIIHDRAMSQARAVQYINLGETIDINTPQGSRTLASLYFRSGGLRNG